ncbi:hypothetical protein [Nocardiopsis alba]|uniref:hypothetical protein n=1 Tax=Nocardiopsis alba TaxID=53437 RepID=UPI003D7481E4
MSDTIHAVVTVSSNYTDEITGYVGNLTAELRDRLSASLRFRRLERVDAVPWTLLRERGALDLVSRAAARGLVWHVAPRIGYRVPWTDFTAYNAAGDVVVRVAWEKGRVQRGYGYTGVAPALRALDEAGVNQ